MKHKPFTRILSLLLVVATLAGLLAVPASAASLGGSGSVTIQQAGFGSYLSKSTGGSIGGGYCGGYSGWKSSGSVPLSAHF